MRFERLHLLRYGAFDGRQIVFRPGAKLHIVYGPNEAGKSTTLSALSALLFGFPHQTAHDFLHKASTLRIAATLSASDGSQIGFRRRKGTKATLLADDDTETPLRDDALAAYLGGLTKTVFENAFGLDSERLRAGADAMLADDGELGGTLLAASSGLTGLKDLRTRFDDEAAELYAPRASKKTFNALKDRWDDARSRARESELRSGDWKKLNDDIRRLAEKHEDEKDRLAELARRRGELEKLVTLEPVVSAIDADLRKLGTFDDLDGLPAGFAEQLSDALMRRSHEASLLDEANRRVRAAQDAVADIRLDETVLAHAKAISALHARVGNYRKALEDAPGVDRERRGFEHEIEDRKQRLGLSAAAAHVPQPTDASLALAGQLAEEGRALAREAALLKKGLETERDKAAYLERQEPAVRLTDPKPLRDRMNALKAEIEAVEQRTALESRHRSEARRIRDEALDLVPPVTDFGRLSAIALPSIESVTRHRDRLAACEAQIGRTRDERGRLANEIARNDKILRESERAGDIPSRAAIEAARSERDETFAPIASIVAGTAKPPEASDALLARFRSRVRSADTLADSAFADIERVQRHADLSARNEELSALVTSIERERDAYCAQKATILAEFAAPFERMGVAATDPDGMIVWLHAMRQLREADRANADLADQLAALAIREEALRPQLSKLGEALWVEDAAGLATGPLARSLERRLDEISEAWLTSRGHAASKKDTQDRIARLEAQSAAAAHERQAWRTRADAAFARLGLAEGATPDQVEATISLWRELPALESQRVNRAERVAGMRRDAHGFEADTRALVALVAPHLADLTAERAVDELLDASEIASRASAKLQERREALDRAQRDVQQRQEIAATADARLAGLMNRCPAGAEPAALVERLTARDAMVQSLAQCRARLVDIAPDWSESDVRSALATFEPSRADLDIADIRKDERDLDAQSNETYAELRDRTRERQALSEGGGAEGAVFEQRAVEAELTALARRWAVLKIAANLASETLERHRRNQDAPLMRRAGERLSRLTDGAFASLSQQFGDNDEAELVAVRDNGERLRISALSDGTRDQLFLALRLAFIEDYAMRNEPIPFIGDDIFQTFDDARTAAGLLTLADVSEHTQPILFAHHRSVTEIARDELADAVDIIEI
ncbi:AAA family ATPase [Fulvimarina sp. 2208YS6-2-32]|uniref:AAA family ATPase n=1 Tax=Fulvimarina uroteuthidis TaxID=3098149 RepID=A0ABU5I3G7_9HYPH|nr:AAA family ATPase [Fulvimarina sp. 2208YS6-2-32]MDY8109751.1 AAA family ATPase [Fulvimarina sp. 2208YS6-2-32]